MDPEGLQAPCIRAAGRLCQMVYPIAVQLQDVLEHLRGRFRPIGWQQRHHALEGIRDHHDPMPLGVGAVQPLQSVQTFRVPLFRNDMAVQGRRATRRGFGQRADLRK